MNFPISIVSPFHLFINNNNKSLLVFINVYYQIRIKFQIEILKCWEANIKIEIHAEYYVINILV